MANSPSFTFITCFIAAAATLFLPAASGHLTPDYYDKICPKALPTIRAIVKRAIQREARMGASLLRLHFHDCFVNGCDGSNLLDDRDGFIGEKTAIPNINSLRGFKVVDEIKAAVNTACHGNVVSCADILAVAARDSVSILGGPWYPVKLGRRDSLTASFNDANINLPPPIFNFSDLLFSFQSHGLNLKDLVVLSGGGHTIGMARCTTFRDRIFNDTNINPIFAKALKRTCPVAGKDHATRPLDSTDRVFDTAYFHDLIKRKGLLHSDQELFKGDGSKSDRLVRYYIKNPGAFGKDFGVSMIKMGNMKPLTGGEGEIRKNCRKVNYKVWY